MKYLYDYSEFGLVDRICHINGIDFSKLDVSDFIPDYNIDIIVNFKQHLLSFKDKRFFIVGDYDCDGICATTIIKKLLDNLGITNNYYIPSRIKDGYGLNKKIVDNAINNSFDVLFLVDNGIVAYEEIEYAYNNGLRVFIIDHHEYENAPKAECFLHPSLFPEEYKDMCAAGICTLLSNSFRYDEITTSYGGLATLADMVSVLGYNRYLIKNTLDLLKQNKVPAINKLIAGNNINYETLSFIAIPKINAVSRLENQMNVNYVVKYLLNQGDVDTYLNNIEAINLLRKDYTKQMYGFAKRNIDDTKDIIVLNSEVFIQGLCGLLANRLMNEYDKPVIILSKQDNQLIGSGRAPAGIDLYSYLKQFSDLYINYGGHAQAIGLTLSTDNFDEFINNIENNQIPDSDVIRNALVIDIDDINDDMLLQLESLKPFGADFTEPFLVIENPKVLNKYLIAKQYPKYVLSDKLEAISFNPGFNDKEFSSMIGKIKADDYYKDRIAFIIEDLI